jgi:predicted RND superfamily exporter protein
MTIGDRAQLARRYVGWIRKHARTIVAAHVLVLAAAVYLIAFKLPLYADFSYLLPQEAPAVRDLRKIDARVKTSDTVLVVIRAPTAPAREAATADMLAGARAIAPDLVQRVDGDDAETRTFLRAHRQLFVPLADLEHARDTLGKRIVDAKLEANPLYVDLDDKKPDTAADRKELDDLRAKRRDAEKKLDKPSNVSDDGLTALLQVRTAFVGTDVGRGESLLAALDAARTRVTAAHPGVEIGLAGGVVTALAEHHALVNGTLLSSIVTTVLVALVLAFYFRSAKLLVMLVGTLVVATASAFGAAVFTVGHLNAATAFLGAIIAGNGINYGILMIARYLEERKHSSPEDALAVAIHATLRPTAVASLGASIAYGSLAATSFRGFADFAVIGAIGMTLCWLATYGLLPALMLLFGRDTRIYRGDPFIGGALVRVVGFKRSDWVVGVAAAVAIVAAAVVTQYVAHDPFEYDIRMLRSEGKDAATERHWMKVSDDAFGRGYAGRTFIAADRPEQVPMIVAKLKDADRGKPIAKHAIGSVESILDVVPERQRDKLAVLADIRKQIDDPALDALDDQERADLNELRPPDDLVAITPADLPPALRDRLTEKDGRLGYLVSIRPGDGIDELDGRDLIRFASAVRRLDLPNGETVTTSGASVIFADIISTVAHDGPWVTLIASVGLVGMVLLVVGRNRRAYAVIAATATGSLLMVAVCALLGLKVNFLDFVALPITLGLGIDYAINVAHRHDHHEVSDPIVTLRTSGAAVFVCSLTTMIGYGSLLVSDNLAIKGFGTASLIGEVTSVSTALVLVPALLALWPRRRT